MNATSSTMRTFVGTCHTFSDQPVAGRIVFFKNGALPEEDACLIVADSLSDTSVWESKNVVGVIQVGTAQLLETTEAPPCPVLTLPDLPEECDGKIALLDPASGVLFVSPDIGVFNRLIPRLSASRPDSPLTLPNGNHLRLGTIFTPRTCLPPFDPECMLLLPDTGEEEELLYERYRDLAERVIGLPLTVILPYARTSSDGDEFRHHVRALFRAAVYGNFSLLIKGILTQQELGFCFSELHRIADELKQDRREHNERIPRGILLDIPLLFHWTNWTGIDFLCLDLDHLWDLFTGYSPRSDWETRCAFLQALCDSHAHQSNLSTSLITNRLSCFPLLSSLCDDWSISNCYVPPHLLNTAQERLSEIPSNPSKTHTD